MHFASEAPFAVIYRGDAVSASASLNVERVQTHPGAALAPVEDGALHIGDRGGAHLRLDLPTHAGVQLHRDYLSVRLTRAHMHGNSGRRLDDPNYGCVPDL